MTPPLLFAFGLHLHQPVGNFDSVFEQHLADVYRPLLTELDRGGTWPVSLHLSGPLLDWLEGHAVDYLDLIGRHVAAGRLELLLAGYDEPILAVLPRDDRIEQVARMREAIRRRFGVVATGLWLTERIWEPDLVADLAAVGVEYVLVDDRHFLVAGFEREALHRPFRTEAGGATTAIFPIDEKLRYLVPFQPPAEVAEYFRALRAAGAPLAVLADDGEKFGGWPGTFEWVYQKGWLTEFSRVLRTLAEGGEIKLVTFRQALEQVASGGLAYLPSASYREMEGWALPPAAAVRLTALEASLGKVRVAGPEGALVRGSHWRNFLVKYSESNRMHKKMIALSAMSRRRGDPAAARRAIGRAQCNDAYWHGVFGGLYLPHLRDGIWRELARAEGVLRAGEALSFESVDLDCDGLPEIWIHSAAFSALVAPHRGGAIEEWTLFAAERNWANTLTRRREAYHLEAQARAAKRAEGPSEGPVGEPTATASIHQLEDALVLDALPPVDAHDRAILQERLLASDADLETLGTSVTPPVRGWAAASLRREAKLSDRGVLVSMAGGGLTKEILFTAAGGVEVRFRWEIGESQATWFTSELSLAGEVEITTDATWERRYPIETVAKSEKGFDRTVQGMAIVLGWEAGVGAGRVSLVPAGSVAS